MLSCAGDGLNDDGINWNRSDTVGRLDMIRVDFPIAGLGSREYVVHIGTLWWFNIAMVLMAHLYIDGLPIKNGDFPGYVK